MNRRPPEITYRLAIVLALAAVFAMWAIFYAAYASAQPRDDFDVWVTIGECDATVTRSGATLEVWVPDLNGTKVDTLDTAGDVWTVTGPAVFTVVLRTPKQMDSRTYEVPACPTTTTVPPDTTTTSTTPPSTTSTTTPETGTTFTSTPPTTVPEQTTTTSTPPTSPPTTSVPPSTPPTSAPPTTITTDDSSTTGELPHTGPYDTLLILGIVGTLALIAGGIMLQRTNERGEG